MNNKLDRFVKAILDFCFCVGIIIEIAVPFGLKKAVELMTRLWRDSSAYSAIPDNYPVSVCSIMIVGAFCILIMYELRRMMQTVIDDDAFVQQNVISLKRMGTYAFCLSIVKLLRCFVYFTPAAIIIAAAFFFAGLFSKVLSRVFDKAVRYKEENDLTI
ncbi:MULTISPECIES: DUF2975 domain-containing protein [Pseudobutyrivibrio]|uniref:DUF2975 domain-containing protein n=1 Tax=Pseudobutyrivibrio xylanivorans TaxID=185007 RepID=A0A1G5RWQ2_PSEXY|nr:MULTISPECIES: DUF2975 domain-containing protein [Pseudobutyrivibrio]MDC7278143.1 DUF2975 domain-containing protein [Butyrivibrio fibrisolvens]SCZ78534.1 Protein of unknown function [Pseudobutyrivibrio xylanivorans]